MQIFETMVNWLYNVIDTIGQFLDVWADWIIGIDDLYAQFDDEDMNVAEQ